MNADDLFDGVTDIRDDLIDGAGESPGRQRRGRSRRLAAAVVVLAVLAAVLPRPGGGAAARAIARAEYPEMAPFPYLESAEYDGEAVDAWFESLRAQRRDLGDTAPLRSFCARSARDLLTGAEGENRVCSPLNVYMALAMLAQLTGGTSREQILTLLGSGSADALRRQAGDVWNSSYRSDGSVTCVLANSLWLNEDISFNRRTLDLLARDLYASSFQGEMGSEALDEALRTWLSQQTGGLLEEQAGNLHLEGDTALALAAAVYFRARWQDPFSPEDTASQVFHGPNGDVETEFMHQRAVDYYFWGERFTALCRPFANSGSMWFVLPAEGMAPEDLLSDPEAVEFLFAENRHEWKNQRWLFVDEAIPKFDVCSQVDLREELEALGVTDVLDPARSDFSPMARDSRGIALTRASHAARVVIDEEGCTAAAFTAMDLAGGGPPEEVTDFVLDRPFLFCVAGDNGLPLFLGVVNSPCA